MGHYTQYFDYHVGLLEKFKSSVQALPPFQISLMALTETDTTFMARLDTLCAYQHCDEEMIVQGQWFIERIVSAYNHLLPYLPRDLLWFFGGDCLHYMPDDEIRFYQQLDELRYAAESQNREFDIIEAKTFIQNNQQ